MIIVDSDILIWVLRNNVEYKNSFTTAVEQSDGQIYITPIQYMEIVAGVRDKEKLSTEIFLESLKMIEIDKNIGKLAGEYLRKYCKSHGVHNADALIAAATKLNSMQLWTNNKKHFPMLKKDDVRDV